MEVKEVRLGWGTGNTFEDKLCAWVNAPQAMQDSTIMAHADLHCVHSSLHMHSENFLVLQKEPINTVVTMILNRLT